MASPIADLSYRNYDGPMKPPIARWWPIARIGILSAFKKKIFWVLVTFSGLWYGILMIVFYFVDTFASQMSGQRGDVMVDPSEAANAILNRVDWTEIFLHGFSRGHLWWFLIALLIAIGTIANDNRANALLVYLSRPCTKLDYIIGKWVGIFVPMVIAVAIPSLFFYGYCFMSYRGNGFLDDRWLIVKLLGLILVPAFFHASVSLGISSLFKQGRLAGATYAGVFFFSYFFTVAMGAIHFQLGRRGSEALSLVDNLYYLSVDGLQIGFAKHILGRFGEQPFPLMTAPSGMTRLAAVPAPNGLLLTLLFFGICGASLMIAWSRVRAVEVVS